jgi:two-component system, LuxR family, response regulator FixJ
MPRTIQPVCILDDDASVLSSLRELLASDGFDAEIFDSPAKFLAYAQEHPIKLAILDVWMPATSGMDVQDRLREFSPDTRVIIITGRPGLAVRAVAVENGSFAFLVKPFEDEVFLGLVRKALDEEP